MGLDRSGAAEQYRHVIPVLVDRMSASAWLYKHTLITCQIISQAHQCPSILQINATFNYEDIHASMTRKVGGNGGVQFCIMAGFIAHVFSARIANAGSYRYWQKISLFPSPLVLFVSDCIGRNPSSLPVTANQYNPYSFKTNPSLNVYAKSLKDYANIDPSSQNTPSRNEAQTY